MRPSRRGDGEDFRPSESRLREGSDDGVADLLLVLHRGKGDRRAAEAATGHAGTDGAMAPCRVHGEVQFRAGDLEIVPHGGVAGIEEGADVGRALGPERVDSLQHAVVFGDDVARPPERRGIEESAGLLEVRDGELPQGLDAEDFGAELARRAAGGVAAVGMRMCHLRVDDQQDESGFPRRRTAPAARTGRRQSRKTAWPAGAAERCRLVHDPGRRSDEGVFRVLGQQNHLLGRKPGTGEFVEGGDDGAFDRVRGGQPGAERDVGVQEQVEAGDLDAVLLQRPDHAEGILGPAGDGARSQCGGVGLDSPWSPNVDSSRTVESSRSRTAVLARLSIAKGRTKPSL